MLHLFPLIWFNANLMQMLRTNDQKVSQLITGTADIHLRARDQEVPSRKEFLDSGKVAPKLFDHFLSSWVPKGNSGGTKR